MSIERKVQLVEMLFYQLEQETAQFTQISGIQCVAGCGKCCTYPDIEASPLEFLPWAFHLFLAGEAEKTLSLLHDNDSPTCMIYKPLVIMDSGRCSNYKDRGLICRLFGAAANTDKYGQLRLATCKIIKDTQAENYKATTKAISEGLHVPIFTEYYMQLDQIDYRLGNTLLPVNEALIIALEEVLQYYTYSPMPESHKECM
ncbi:MAG: YkgJ family cysteine cluster protein [Paludibacteraceae bacterium]|nr:YkgJ family cysteine cluster protein [Paludibacteraceae bacterium]MBP6284390.1 YkgJ family cysteine cluster protein [Paludibacteraceae bacterium]